MTDSATQRDPMLWLDAAFATRTQNISGVIKPVRLGDGQACFGIVIGARWICGGDGSMTTFATRQAARRFLRMLGFSHVIDDIGEKYSMPAAADYAMFQLRHQRLHQHYRSSLIQETPRH